MDIQPRTYTAEDCAETGYQMSIAGKVVVLKSDILPNDHPGQLFYCSGGNGANPNPMGRSVFCWSLTDGECSRWWRADVVGALKPELLPDAERLMLSQIRPSGMHASPLEAPEYHGYCFLPNGKYTNGVPLRDVREVKAYVEMQAPYQHKLMVCDRDDFCVFEMEAGKILHPAQAEALGMAEPKREPEVPDGPDMHGLEG